MKIILLLFLLLFLMGCKKKPELRQLSQPQVQALPLMGMHTNHMNTSWPLQLPFDCWRNLSATGQGSANSWASIQTSANTYNFQTIDAAMTDMAAQNKTCVVYTPEWTPDFIAGTSGWSTDGSTVRHCACTGRDGVNACYPPTDLNKDGLGTNQTWKNFITNLANHVHSKHQQSPSTYADITFWSNGNEYADNGNQWCGSFKQLARMMSDEKAIINGINPTAKIMTISIFNDQKAVEYLTTLAPNGDTPAKMADMIDTHNDYVPGNNPEQAVPALMAMRREVDSIPDSQGKPIFNTEGGWCCSKQPDTWAHAATFISRFMLGVSSTGIYAHIFFGYDFNNANTTTGPGECCNVFIDTVNTKGCTIAMANGYFCSTAAPYTKTIQWMQGIAFNAPCAGSNNTWTCQATGAVTKQFVWYSVLDQTSQYTVPQSFAQMEDINGQVTSVHAGDKITISNSPVMLVSQGVLPIAPQNYTVTPGVINQ